LVSPANHKRVFSAQNFLYQTLTGTQQERNLSVAASFIYLCLNLRHYFCAMAGFLKISAAKVITNHGPESELTTEIAAKAIAPADSADETVAGAYGQFRNPH
jgi:hypothetical protein